jgi:acetyl-CoA C-acetyltransferase
MNAPDPSRIPVLVGIGQSIERAEIVSAFDMAERAARAALADAPGLEPHIARVSVVAISFSSGGVAPASELAKRLGLDDARCETSTPGGNMPQWLVNRAASDIAAGRLDATLIAGAEAARSARASSPQSASFMEQAARRAAEGPSEEVVGPSISGVLGRALGQARVYEPALVYPLFESARAHEAGRSYSEQRRFLAPFMARFSQIAAEHPYAWFRRARSPEELATPTSDNRLVSQPYTKLVNAFPYVDQGSALLLTSLARARALGLGDRCVFPWAGASTSEPQPAARRQLGESPALGAAARAALSAAEIGVDDIAHFDLYSCFPVAVEVAAEALDVDLLDPRDLSVTGGLPFFGGPGNNYSGHAIATLVERLREAPGVGYVSANGGLLSKHAVGIYGATPPVLGFRLADTSKEQAEIDAAAIPVALEASGEARVEADTVHYDREGVIASAPIVARLDDGRRIVAQAEPGALGERSDESLVGERVRVEGAPPLYRPA